VDVCIAVYNKVIVHTLEEDGLVHEDVDVNMGKRVRRGYSLPAQSNSLSYFVRKKKKR
jgi:hypothetical protein